MGLNDKEIGEILKSLFKKIDLDGFIAVYIDGDDLLVYKEDFDGLGAIATIRLLMKDYNLSITDLKRIFRDIEINKTKKAKKN